MNGDAGKGEMGKLLTKQDLSEHFVGEHPVESLKLRYKRTKCWRFIPKEYNGQEDNYFKGKERVKFPRHMNIDGEKYPTEPIQAKVLSKSLKVCCFNK